MWEEIGQINHWLCKTAMLSLGEKITLFLVVLSSGGQADTYVAGQRVCACIDVTHLIKAEWKTTCSSEAPDTVAASLQEAKALKNSVKS